MHNGTFPRAAIRARKRTVVHLRAEKIGASSDPNPADSDCVFKICEVYRRVASIRVRVFVRVYVEGRADAVCQRAPDGHQAARALSPLPGLRGTYTYVRVGHSTCKKPSPVA